MGGRSSLPKILVGADGQRAQRNRLLPASILTAPLVTQYAPNGMWACHSYCRKGHEKKKTQNRTKSDLAGLKQQREDLLAAGTFQCFLG